MTKKILMVTDNPFWRKTQGSQARIAAICDFIQQSHHELYVLFLGYIEAGEEKRILEDFSKLKFFCHPPGHPKINQFKQTLKQILPEYVLTLIKEFKLIISQVKERLNSNRYPIVPEKKLDEFSSPQQLDFFLEFCQERSPDIIIVEYIRLAYLIQNYSEKVDHLAHTIIDTHDVMYRRNELFHRNHKPHWLDITREEESAVLDQFDSILAIQASDAQIFQSMLPGKSILTVGHISEIVYHASPPSYHQEVTLSFLAARSLANVISITEFIEEVWVSIHHKFSGKVRLNIAGNICSYIEKYPGLNVNLLGFIENLYDFYDQTDIVVNPIRLGGGLKIKNVEALCHGKPLVTTSIGAEGLEAGIDNAFFVCDQAEMACQKLGELIEDVNLRQYMSANAHEFAEQHFTPETAYRELYSLLMS